MACRDTTRNGPRTQFQAAFVAGRMGYYPAASLPPRVLDRRSDTDIGFAMAIVSSLSRTLRTVSASAGALSKIRLCCVVTRQADGYPEGKGADFLPS